MSIYLKKAMKKAKNIHCFSPYDRITERCVLRVSRVTEHRTTENTTEIIQFSFKKALNIRKFCIFCAFCVYFLKK